MVCAPLRQEISRLRAITEPKISIPISTCSSARNDVSGRQLSIISSPTDIGIRQKMVCAPLRQEISRPRATTEQKHLSPYPRAAPLEMTERQAAFHHFKPHGYRNTSKNGLRPFATGDFSTQSHNRAKTSIPISTCSSARNDRAAGSFPSFQSPRI